MRKLFVLAAVCILALPLWSSSSQGEDLVNSAPFATVAIAGHVTPSGRYCNCDDTGGVCSSGEQPGNNLTVAPSSQPKSDRNADPSNLGSVPDFDFGSGAMLLAIAVMALLRMR